MYHHCRRVYLTGLPTPLEDVPRFSEYLGGPRVLVKRDDSTSLAMGGNKARKLEFLIGHALSLGATHVLTVGGPQSNHARMTAAAARKFGLKPVVVLEGEDPGERQGNLLLDAILGAEIVFSGKRDVAEVMHEIADDLHRKGHIPYEIPLGGSNAVGTLGYVPCVAEILEQSRSLGIQPRDLFVATGSCGTLAGLLLGKLLYGADFRVTGVAVSPGIPEKTEQTVRLVEEALILLEDAELRKCVAPGVPPERIYAVSREEIESEVRIDGDQIGPGYGIPTPECIEAITLLARTEGILADPVYTGKALAGLVARIRGGKLGRSDIVVFVHTGGVPANFAFSDELLKGRIEF